MDYEALAKQLYPEAKMESYGLCGIYGYQPIVDYCGEVLIQFDDRDYQGDTFAIVKKNDQLGFLQFGWGSCSGCDALQAAHTLEKVGMLASDIESGVHWFNTGAELVKWLDEAEERNEYFVHSYSSRDGSFSQLREQARAMFGG